jgi:hypothetical protein
MPMSWMFYTGESGTLEGCYGEVIEPYAVLEEKQLKLLVVGWL